MAHHARAPRQGQIRILIVTDMMESGQTIRQWLSTVAHLGVMGIVNGGEEAIDFARRHQPDIILMEIDLPRMDGFAATDEMMRLRLPVQVILMGNEDSKEIMQHAMGVGARYYLPKPLRMNEMLRTIHRLVDMPPPVANGPREPHAGHLVAVCGAKGGVGASMVATNLAVALHTQAEDVLLIDGRLTGGDDHILLNLEHVTHSIEMLRDPEELDLDSLQRIATRHESGVRFVRAPEHGEAAHEIGREALTAILTDARDQFDVVVVDCDATFNEVSETILEEAQRILIVLTPELTAINRLKVLLDQLRRRNIPLDRLRIIINRIDGGYQISARRLEQSLGIKFAAHLPDDGYTVITAINRGAPLVRSAPRTPLARALVGLAQGIYTDLAAVTVS